MVQVLGQEGLGDIIGQSLGQGLGQGIAGGLQQMLEQKRSMKNAVNISQALGRPEYAQVLGSFSAQDQMGVLKLLQEQESNVAASQALQSLLGGSSEVPQDLLGQQAADPMMSEITEPLAEVATSGQQGVPRLSGIKPDAAFKLANIGLKKQRMNADEKKLALGETKEFRDKLSKEAQSAEELEPVLNQMISLVEGGKLSNPVFAKLLDKAGLNGLLNPESQQFQALAVGFLKDAKNLFGSRVTNFDLQTYIDKIPRLAQTDEGKKVLIDNFRTLGEVARIRNHAKNDILRENRNVPPLDLEEQVNKRSKPLIDKEAKKFNSSLKVAKKVSGSDKDTIEVVSPDGTRGRIPADRLSDAMKKGFKKA
jgi:hypothetical protein